jgi:hypothetical protein
MEKDFINKTKAVFQQHCSHKLNDEDAINMINNISNFFDLLNKWDKFTDKRDE